MFGLMLGCVSMSADNRLSKSGYAGKIGLSVTPTGPGVDITTSHGYSFGNGLWIGGGAGVSCSDSNSYDYLCLLFTEAKYNILRDNKVSPYIDCKLGYATDFDKCYSYISPALGIDLGKFSIFASYEMISQMRITHIGFSFNF